MDLEASDVERIVGWVKKNGFQRVAVQLPDELLPLAPRTVLRLLRELPGRKVFVLGDSPYGSSSVDEVGAEHYGADCIVKVGPSDQQQVNSAPVLFVFGRRPFTQAGCSPAVSSLRDHFSGLDSRASLVIVCDVALQHSASCLASELSAPLGDLCDVLIAEPPREAARSSVQRRDLRFGAVPAAAWWSALGPLTAAAAAVREPWRVCGREVREVEALRPPTHCGFLHLGAAGSALERRLLLRHGHAHPVWRLESDGAVRLSSDSLLLQRYRFVEVARSAGVVGLLLSATGAPVGQAVTDRLETLLRRAGRQVYRFVIGQPTVEKLGNFPGVECFVSLASPEHFPFNVRDFHVPIASPYEVEVALGAREWSGDYITDLDELLSTASPEPPATTEALPVQTLGARARVITFSSGGGDAQPPRASAPDSQVATGTLLQESRPPAVVAPGLHGVPSRYASEEAAFF